MNQLPFTSINYGLDTSYEGQIINEALIDGCMKGVGKTHRTSIFPCGIFQYMKGVNDKPGTPNYYLKKKAIASTVRRFYPNYINGNWSVQTEGIRKDREQKYRVIERWKIEKPVDYRRLCVLIEQEPEIGRKLNLVLVRSKDVFKNDTTDINVNFDTNVQNEFEVISTMGCRTYNGFDINFDEEYFESLLLETLSQGKLPNNYLYSAMQKDGRGNIAPNTIILPTIAMEAKLEAESLPNKTIVDVFMARLTEAIEDAKDELIERFAHISSQPAAAAKFMYENNTMKGYIPEQGIISALKHGTLALGQIGLAECLYILIGCDQTEPEGLELAKTIERLFKTKCEEYKHNYKLNFGVYYSPAENLCYTSFKKFVKKYGLIENVTAYKDEETGELKERGFWSNSIHIPVWKQVDPFTKIDIESQLTGFSSAGCITYVELENAKFNEKSVEQILDYAMSKDIPYMAFNVSVDNCLDCGFIDEDEVFASNGDKCPRCNSERIEKPRRVTGYLTGDYRVAFNKGKQEETNTRVKHTRYLNKFNNIKWKNQKND